MAPNHLALALGRAVHSFIREAGLNITSTGRATEIPRRTMVRSVNGERCFSIEDLYRLAPVLGTSVAEILARAERIAEKAVA